MRRHWTIIVLIATSLTAAAAAFAGDGNNREQVRLNATDTAAARAVLLRRSDLPTSRAWHGGRTKPDLSSGRVTCANFHPKRTDLIVTGGAESDFSHGLFNFDNLVKVLKTTRMVRLDWQRVALAPGLLSCMRHYIATSLPADSKLVSIQRLSFPHVARYTYAARVVIRVAARGSTLRLLLDFATFARGRTLINFTNAMPYAARATARPEEIRLARILVARVRA
jgi:hypothetical protein